MHALHSRVGALRAPESVQQALAYLVSSSLRRHIRLPYTHTAYYSRERQA